MDFTFKSDDNTTMNKKALYNLQIIKKFCLVILNKVKKQQNRSLKRIRKSISRNIEKETVEIFKYYVILIPLPSLNKIIQWIETL